MLHKMKFFCTSDNKKVKSFFFDSLWNYWASALYEGENWKIQFEGKWQKETDLDVTISSSSCNDLLGVGAEDNTHHRSEKSSCIRNLKLFALLMMTVESFFILKLNEQVFTFYFLLWKVHSGISLYDLFSAHITFFHAWFLFQFHVITKVHRAKKSTWIFRLHKFFKHPWDGAKSVRKIFFSFAMRAIYKMSFFSNFFLAKMVF
jgi:hypothetical protein